MPERVLVAVSGALAPLPLEALRHKLQADPIDIHERVCERARQPRATGLPGRVDEESGASLGVDVDRREERLESLVGVRDAVSGHDRPVVAADPAALRARPSATASRIRVISPSSDANGG